MEMLLDYLDQKYIEQELLDQAEIDVSTFLQSLGIEIQDISAYEFIKPHRIAMDDVEDGDTMRLVASGEIIVDVCVRSKHDKRVIMTCVKYEEGKFFNWEVTIGTDIYFLVKNREDFYKFKTEYILS